MKKNLMIAAMLLLLALSACQAAPKNTQSEPTATANASTGGQAQTPAAVGYPEPAQAAAYPQPGSGETGASIAEAYPAAEGDENLAAGNFNFEKAGLVGSTTKPGYTDVVVTGNLPTPCHQLRVKVTPPDNTNKIVVTVYTVAEKDKICTQQTMPFQGTVATLGGYPAGKYTVVVNDQPSGEFEIK